MTDKQQYTAFALIRIKQLVEGLLSIHPKEYDDKVMSAIDKSLEALDSEEIIGLIADLCVERLGPQ